MSDPASPGGALERTLHRDYYLSDHIFALERERIFFREWFCAAREEEIPDPGRLRGARGGRRERPDRPHP